MSTTASGLAPFPPPQAATTAPATTYSTATASRWEIEMRTIRLYGLPARQSLRDARSRRGRSWRDAGEGSGAHGARGESGADLMCPGRCVREQGPADRSELWRWKKQPGRSE